MKTAGKRKYKGDFGVSIGFMVPPKVFNEIEDIAKALGTTRAGVARQLLLRGLAEYHREGDLTGETNKSTCDPDFFSSSLTDS